MKNQYFGDINDYRKYGLIRVLSNKGAIRTMVCWMLTENDSRTDGKHVSYLQKTDSWRMYDPELYGFLQDCLIKNNRNVKNIEKTSFLPSSKYYSTIVTDSREQREKYFSGLHALARNCDIVFFDPDNGIEVKSIKYGAKNSCKYVYWKELKASFEAGQSLLVYQHFPRMEHRKYISMIAERIQSELHVQTVVAMATAHVVYFLVPQDHRVKYFQQRVEVLQSVWGERFGIEWFGV